jgi:hypothetical protein
VLTDEELGKESATPAAAAAAANGETKWRDLIFNSSLRRMLKPTLLIDGSTNGCGLRCWIFVPQNLLGERKNLPVKLVCSVRGPKFDPNILNLNFF